MIVYKDRSWCSMSAICSNYECSRNYDEVEQSKNTQGLLLSWTSFKTDSCGFLPKNEKQSQAPDQA